MDGQRTDGSSSSSSDRPEPLPSRRKRSRSLMRTLSYVFLGVGAVAVTFGIAVMYSPDSANPVEVSADPLFGITGVVSFGILCILLGALGYFYSIQAGL